MSRTYIHNFKYHSRNRRMIALISLAVVLALILFGVRLDREYHKLHNSPSSDINNSAGTLFGYINPYFMFKDTGKWVQDKANSTADEIIYYHYVNGEAANQLTVYINKTPPNAQLLSTHVLPVQVTNGDSLAAGSLSTSCTIPQVCDPDSQDYSVILAEQGGSYVLHMSKSKVPETFVVVYKDYSPHPDAQSIINIANNFRAI